MKKKILALLLGGIMTGAVLSGCGNSTKDNTAESSADSEAADQAAETVQESLKVSEDGKRTIEGELNLALFQGGYGADFWEELIARFEKEYPDVTVKYELNPKIGDILRPKIISGDVPDLIYHNQGQSDGVILGMIKDKQLMDLTELFDEKPLDKEGKLKDIILNGMLESSTLSPYGDGKIYLAPFSTAPSGLIYNKTLFDEKGWKVPQTWDEFFALGDTAKEEGRSLITFAGIYPTYFENLIWPSVAEAAGLDALNDIFNYKEGSFSNEKVMEVLENIQKIADGDYVLQGTTGMNHTQSQSEMMLGKALFIPNGTWIENEMKDAPREGDEKFQFALLPGLKLEASKSTYVSAVPEQISIPKDAKNPEAAKEFIKFIYTDENIKLFGEKAQGLMAVKNSADLIKDYISPNMYTMFSVLNNPDVITYAGSFASVPPNSKFSYATEIFEKGLVPVMNKEITAKEWSDKAEKEFKEVSADIAAADKK